MVIVGEADHHITQLGSEYINSTLQQRFKNAKYQYYSIKDAGHLFEGCEVELASVINENISFFD